MLTRRHVLASSFLPLASSGQEVFANAVRDIWSARLIAAAEGQIGVTTIYDPKYVRISFPGGDIPLERGVCTDVIIRAYRALGFDLQQAVNADKKRAETSYPARWGKMPPDSNIDHRRVPNLQVFFRRMGAEKPIPVKPEDWQPGDLVTQMLPGNLPHIGICAVERGRDGAPLVIHNIGRGTQKEPILLQFQITGRYRFAPPGRGAG